MARDLSFSNAARAQLQAGVDKLANTVRVTLGPKGRYVLIEKLTGAPTVTNDGVTIAREIHLSDAFENMGAQLVKQVATQTNDDAGDGTTTATVLAQAMVRRGLSLVDEGANPVLLKRGIIVAVNRVVEQIRSMAQEISTREEFAHVASISANNDRAVGEAVAEAMAKVGPTGIITVEESPVVGYQLDFVEGLEFDQGYVSPYMVTDTDRMVTEFEDPYILLTNRTIDSVQTLMPLLDKIMKDQRPLVIIAQKVEGPALGMLVTNAAHGTFQSVAVNAPGFGHRRLAELQDIAVLTGGTVISEDAGLTIAAADASMLGTARKVTVTEGRTTIIDGAGSEAKVAHRVEQMHNELGRASNEHDQDTLRERIARLSGGVAVISVGAVSAVELSETLHRVEDALSATRASIQEGIIGGGGSALIHAESALDGLGLEGDEALGAQIVRDVLSEPLRWIASNAGYDSDDAIAQVRALPPGSGLNALTGEYVDLIAEGVLDPARVTRSALQSAASIVALMLVTEVLVIEEQVAQPGAIMVPGFGDLAEGMARPTSDAATPV